MFADQLLEFVFQGGFRLLEADVTSSSQHPTVIVSLQILDAAGERESVQACHCTMLMLEKDSKFTQVQPIDYWKQILRVRHAYGRLFFNLLSRIRPSHFFTEGAPSYLFQSYFLQPASTSQDG